MSETFRVANGDVIAKLREMPESSVHSVVTSPPYLGLRSYGIEPSVWGGNPRCQHVFAETRVPGGNGDGLSFRRDRAATNEPATATQPGFCQCGAWKGCLGLEPTVELFVEHMVAVFREVRRVMRPEATCWLNLGDSYANRSQSGGGDPTVGVRNLGGVSQPHLGVPPGLKPKDLSMIPERVVLALQADGWYVRSRIPWLKRNGMPESAVDRPTTMTEYIFLLSKSEDCYYDREAVRVLSTGNAHSRGHVGVGVKRIEVGRGVRSNDSFNAVPREPIPSRARRNTDWFFEQLQHFASGGQGLMLDEAGEPLAMIVNPQPFAIEMCGDCQTCYEARDYKRLAAECACEGCGHLWTEDAGAKPAKGCPGCGSKAIRRTRKCECGSIAWVSHFATFPERLVTPCILAGTSEYGACALCGAPYKRILERAKVGDWSGTPGRHDDPTAVKQMAAWAKESRVESKAAPNGSQFSSMRMDVNTRAARDASGDHDNPFPAPATLGWRATCSHPLFPEGEPIPCVVLDPFSGSGRTGLAAVRLGRHYRGVEANPKYVAMSEWQAEKLDRAPEPAEALA